MSDTKVQLADKIATLTAERDTLKLAMDQSIRNLTYQLSTALVERDEALATIAAVREHAPKFGGYAVTHLAVQGWYNGLLAILDVPTRAVTTGCALCGAPNTHFRGCPTLWDDPVRPA